MLRRILQIILSKKQFKKIKKESKEWFLKCPDCDYFKSIWDRGGIRFGANSKKKKEFGHCPKCKKRKLLDVIKK